MMEPKLQKEENLQTYKEKKKGSLFMTCGLMVVCALLFVFGWGAWTAAATGLVQVPMISSAAFTRPIPSHLVRPGVLLEDSVPTYFKETFIKRFQEGGGKITDRSVSIPLSEQSITASLQSQLQNSRVDFVDVKQAQVAVLENKGLEIFLPITIHQQTTAVKAEVSISASNKTLQLVLGDVQIGSVLLPSFLVQQITQPYINDQLQTLNRLLGSYMRVENVQYDNGRLLLNGTFEADVK